MQPYGVIKVIEMLSLKYQVSTTDLVCKDIGIKKNRICGEYSVSFEVKTVSFCKSLKTGMHKLNIFYKEIKY